MINWKYERPKIEQLALELETDKIGLFSRA